MTPLSLGVVGVALLVGAISASSTAEPQGKAAPRFEYLDLTPTVMSPAGPNIRFTYSACIARTDLNLACRSFESRVSARHAQQTALATLGAEGWELVSAMGSAWNPFEDPTLKDYVFKRQKS